MATDSPSIPDLPPPPPPPEPRSAPDSQRNPDRGAAEWDTKPVSADVPPPARELEVPGLQPTPEFQRDLDRTRAEWDSNLSHPDHQPDVTRPLPDQPGPVIGHVPLPPSADVLPDRMDTTSPTDLPTSSEAVHELPLGGMTDPDRRVEPDVPGTPLRPDGRPEVPDGPGQPEEPGRPDDPGRPDGRPGPDQPAGDGPAPGPPADSGNLDDQPERVVAPEAAAGDWRRVGGTVVVTGLLALGMPNQESGGGDFRSEPLHQDRTELRAPTPAEAPTDDVEHAPSEADEAESDTTAGDDVPAAVDETEQTTTDRSDDPEQPQGDQTGGDDTGTEQAEDEQGGVDEQQAEELDTVRENPEAASDDDSPEGMTPFEAVYPLMEELAQRKEQDERLEAEARTLETGRRDDERGGVEVPPAGEPQHMRPVRSSEGTEADPDERQGQHFRAGAEEVPVDEDGEHARGEGAHFRDERGRHARDEPARHFRD